MFYEGIVSVPPSKMPFSHQKDDYEHCTGYVPCLDHKVLWKSVGALEIHIYSFGSWMSNPVLEIL